MTTLADAILKFCKSLGNYAAWFLRQRGRALFVGVVMFLVIYEAWNAFRAATVRELAILTGKAGSNSFFYGRRLREELTGRTSAFGQNYTVKLLETGGFDDIRQQIGDDAQGATIGFLQDAHNNAPKALALGPLGHDYLHVLARADVLKNEAPEAASRSMRALAGKLQPGRVYLGPMGSGGRALAELTLESCGLRDPSRLAANGIGDWFEMRSAFLRKEIDLAFFLGPLGSKVIYDVARDDNCVLIDLEEIAEAITAEYREYHVARFAPNAYPSPVDAKQAFCAGCATLSARRLLACSAAMSVHDAYQVLDAANAALRDDFPNGLWNQEGPDGKQVALKTPVHQGAALARDGKTLPSWGNVAMLPSWLVGLITALATAGIAAGLDSLRVRLDRAAAGESGGSAAKPEPDQPLPAGSPATTALIVAPPTTPVVVTGDDEAWTHWMAASDRLCARLKELAENQRSLTPEQQAEMHRLLTILQGNLPHLRDQFTEITVPAPPKLAKRPK